MANAARQARAQVLTLRSDQRDDTLRDALCQSLQDGQPEHGAGTSYAYTRSIPTLVLYTDKGLSIYKEITESKASLSRRVVAWEHTPSLPSRSAQLSSAQLSSADRTRTRNVRQAYYPFEAEREILDKHGDEIAARMFGLPTRTSSNQHTDGGSDHQHSNGDHLGPRTTAVKEKWGDSNVGKHNEGVNGNASAIPSRIGLAVELGSGSLDKTRLLLASCSKLLNRPESPLKAISYKALDLEHQSLVESLETLLDVEPDTVKHEMDNSPRVHIAGLHADYWEGLDHLQNGAGAAKDGRMPLEQTMSILWLGSSVGNFHRDEAVQFLRNVKLGPGDTLLIGVDSCDDKAKVENAYNDPEGVTRRFIFEGIDHAGRTLHSNDESPLHSRNFEYVSHYNKEMGRHEAYLRCKVNNLKIELPDSVYSPASTIYLKENELLNIEFSYKYTELEAHALFQAAGFRVVQRWSDHQQLHSVYLLEQPSLAFPSFAPIMRTIGADLPENPYGLPTMDDWQRMFRAWDALTAAFRDIHLARVLGQALTEPAHFADIFERGIDPDCDEPSKVTHWHSQVPDEGKWPSAQDIFDYERRVRARLEDVYQRHSSGMSRKLARALMMVYEHEAMHFETLVYIAIQACTSLRPATGLKAPDFASLSHSWNERINFEGEVRHKTLDFPAQSIEIGHDDSESLDDKTPYEEDHEFGWDIENPRRSAHVEAFRIDAVPVSNKQYLEFLTSQATDSERLLIPASWYADKGAALSSDSIRVKTLYGLVDFAHAEHWPVTGSALQMEAYAEASSEWFAQSDHSQGGRLPTREELAVFFKTNPIDLPSNNIGLSNLHPVPAMAPSTLRDGTVGAASNGGVWLWTSTVFDSHPGYEPSVIYPGYSSDFFDGQHRVIMGASFATPTRLARPSFQNWYQAKYPYVLAGARIVRS
ncbi:hypothetical protein OIV83_002667 [Microbotryomycetes sp. JL201]|nr:hypothetical protein OIV83_002667 [Microbotryomycetes sp. JL201]